MSKSNIKAEFQSNYNGWVVEVDGYENHDLIDRLICLSADWCDEDGYEYGGDLIRDHREEVNSILLKFSPSADIEITTDSYSS